MLTAADIPVMPLNSLEDLLADPHLDATGFFSLSEHPSEGTLRSMGAEQPVGRNAADPRGRRRGSASTAPRCCAKPVMAPRKSMR